LLAGTEARYEFCGPVIIYLGLVTLYGYIPLLLYFPPVSFYGELFSVTLVLFLYLFGSNSSSIGVSWIVD
jgi:hypothetical protein